MIEWKRLSGPVLALTYLGWFGMAAICLVVLAVMTPIFEMQCKDLGLALPGDVVLLFAAARATRTSAGLLATAGLTLAPLAFLAIPSRREWKILAVTVVTTAVFVGLLAVAGVLFHAWWLISAARTA
jgi:hypothetical protein